MTSSESIKTQVLSKIAGDRATRPAGRSIVSVGSTKIHVRYCSSPTYKFNINPNTLRADFELWICGSADRYYLIPIAVIRELYEHPDAYVDSYHPEIRIVSIMSESDEVMYAAGGVKKLLGPYRNSALP